MAALINRRGDNAKIFRAKSRASSLETYSVVDLTWELEVPEVFEMKTGTLK